MIRKIEVLKAFDGHPVGAVVSVTCDQTGTPLDRNWRRRLKDAKTDNCCKILAAPKSRSKIKPNMGASR